MTEGTVGSHMANHPPILVDAATGRPLLRSDGAECDALRTERDALRADLYAIRTAYLDAAGTNGTLPEIVGAVCRGANPERALVESRESNRIACEGLTAACLHLKDLEEALAEARTDCAHLQEALDDSEHKRICAYRPPSEHTMTEALADAVTRAVAAEGEAELLRAALAKCDATISVLRETIAALSEREATITELRAKDRASIVAFLAAEAKRIDDAAERVDDEDHGVTGKRLRAQASIGRTWTAQIERGDDRQGGA